MKKKRSNLADIPVCMGMERSGSTLSWQMLCRALNTRLVKSHDYVEGSSKCIYTYRHPADAYFSLRARFVDVYAASLAVSHARNRICSQKETYNKLLKDSQKGRKVLFLKYEDYYNYPEKRLLDILQFFNVSIPQERFINIINETSIDKNFKLSKGKNFGTMDEETKLHGNHINPNSLGRPGFFLNHSNIREMNDEAMLQELCDIFGYRRV